MRRSLLFSVLLALVLALGGTPPAQALAAPSSMASVGDSITRAANVCCWYGDHPANSWTTGGASLDGITSHYERLRVLNPDFAGHYNDAKSGARMSDAPGQAQLAVTQKVGYVTILMGANDACTSSPASMTPVETFRSQFRQTLQILDAGLPGSARIFVASVPDVYRLWQIYYTDWLARLVWETANICQSLLASERTEAERLAVRHRVIAFNTVLQEECAAVMKCRFDNAAVFNYPFTRTHVSKLDYFHPSLAGQAALAQLTWPLSWWA